MARADTIAMPKWRVRKTDAFGNVIFEQMHDWAAEAYDQYLKLDLAQGERATYAVRKAGKQRFEPEEYRTQSGRWRDKAETGK